jgi:uncharacterized protein
MIGFVRLESSSDLHCIGSGMGTSLAFMMAVILKRVLKMPLLVTFFAVIALGIILIGYMFNWIL